MENSSTTEQPTLLQHAFRWALITAGVSITYTMLLYIIDYTLMVQLKMLFIALAVYFGITIYAGVDYRKSIGGFLPYGKAFQHGFIILAVSGLFASLFNLLLYFVIDPELPQKLVDASLENTRAMMESFGAPEESMDEAMEKARESSAKQFTVAGMAMGYIWIAVFSAIMALISSLFVRRNQPEVM
jgi:uncharacterized integral membrane protein